MPDRRADQTPFEPINQNPEDLGCGSEPARYEHWAAIEQLGHELLACDPLVGPKWGLPLLHEFLAAVGEAKRRESECWCWDVPLGEAAKVAHGEIKVLRKRAKAAEARGQKLQEENQLLTDQVGSANLRVAELQRALRQIQDELGVPDNTYPASVANAWEIAGAGGVWGEGECIGWPDCYCGSGLTSHSPRCEKVRREGEQ